MWVCDKDTESVSHLLLYCPRQLEGSKWQIKGDVLWSHNLNQIPELLQTQLESSYLQSFYKWLNCCGSSLDPVVSLNQGKDQEETPRSQKQLVPASTQCDVQAHTGFSPSNPVNWLKTKQHKFPSSSSGLAEQLEHLNLPWSCPFWTSYRWAAAVPLQLLHVFSSQVSDDKRLKCL